MARTPSQMDKKRNEFHPYKRLWTMDYGLWTFFHPLQCDKDEIDFRLNEGLWTMDHRLLTVQHFLTNTQLLY
jgi:hypothetical protein